MDTSDDQQTLDDLFDALERMPVPEGYRVEIVAGTIFMSPQVAGHWRFLWRIVRTLEDAFGLDGDYATETIVAFGETKDLTGALPGLTLDTSGFPSS